MSIYKDTIRLNRGINSNGGAFWCQNIRPATNDGVFAGISMVNRAIKTATTPTSDLGGVVNFVQLGEYPVYNILCKDTSGDIYFMDSAGSSTTKAMDYSQTIGAAQGLMVDTNNNVVYTGSEYIGRMFSTTLDGNITSASGTIDLVNGADFPDSGYGFIGEALKFEVIQWTGKSFNQLTGVTRGKYYTTAQSHSTGSKVYYFKDDWIQFNSSLTTSTRRCITWENMNYFVSGNIIEGYTGTATACSDYLTLESDKVIVDIGTLSTSSTSYILVGANSGENGYVYVWDGRDTATISEKELKNNNITRMWENYVATNSGIYQYDGTNLELIVSPVENDGSIVGGRFSINDMKTVKNYLLFTGGIETTNRNRKGFWYVDLTTKDRYFVLPSSYGWYDIDFYGIFPTYSLVLVGTTFGGGAVDNISEYPASRGSLYQALYNPTNSKTLQLKSLKLNISVDEKEEYNSTNINFDVVVRGYDFTRPFIKKSELKTSETPSGSSQLIIVDSLGVPSVGDRLEIIGRDVSGVVNSACAPRTISNITSGTSKYTIDVSEAFPVAINLTTQNNSPIVIFNPLIELGKKKISVNNAKLDLRGYDIPLSIQPYFKKMLFEIEVRCGDITIAPQLNSLEITYEG